MNGSVGFAYTVAKNAVEYNPKSIPWRQKLAQAALWSGNAEIALQQWLYFIKNNITPEEYIPKALTIADQLHNYDAQAYIRKLQLQKNPNDKALNLAYITALRFQGYPEQALEYLKNISGSEKDYDFLMQYIEIASSMDDPILKERYLKLALKVQPTNMGNILSEASIYYSTGDIKKAYQIYKNAASSASGEDNTFWNQYAQIAVLANEKNAAITAYKHLLYKGTIDIASASELISLQYLSGQTQNAYDDARFAYNKTHNPVIPPQNKSIQK